MEYFSKSVSDTQNIAQSLVQQLLQNHNGEPIIIALEGELGAGKTTFVQALAKQLNIDHDIKSPTFLLMRKYEIPDSDKYHSLYHIDCYRLADEKDLIALAVPEILKERGNIVLIEWAERVKPILPEEHITIHIDHIAENERKIKIKD